MAEIIEGENVGISVDGFSPDVLQTGLARLLELVETPGIMTRCVAVACQHFSLDEEVRRYAGGYRDLLGKQYGRG